MVFDTSSLIPKGTALASGGVSVLVYVVLGVVILLMLGGIIAFFMLKRKWNLSVEFKLIRSDGRMVNAEWGKGYYNAKKGVVFIKRPGSVFKCSDVLTATTLSF